jgi:hypothetical protein
VRAQLNRVRLRRKPEGREFPALAGLRAHHLKPILPHPPVKTFHASVLHRSSRFLDESIDSRHDDVTGESWLHGCFT